MTGENDTKENGNNLIVLSSFLTAARGCKRMLDFLPLDGGYRNNIEKVLPNAPMRTFAIWCTYEFDTNL
jgi:hypothetical protein